MLSHIFQNKFENILIISSVVKIDTVQIHTFFIEETIDLKSETFNEQIRYYILSKFCSEGRYLKRLSNEIIGGKVMTLI